MSSFKPNKQAAESMPVKLLFIRKKSAGYTASVKRMHHILSIGSWRANSTANWQRFSGLLPSTQYYGIQFYSLHTN